MGSPNFFKKGIILSVRPVIIKGTESGVGAAAGAGVGAIAGSTLGGNRATRALGGLGGAVLGGVIGHKAENMITGGDASEFIVQPDRGDPYSIVQVNNEELKVGERVLIIESLFYICEISTLTYGLFLATKGLFFWSFHVVISQFKLIKGSEIS